MSKDIDWDAVMKRVVEKGMSPNTEFIVPENYLDLDKSSLFDIDPKTYDLWKQTAELGPIDWDLVIKRMIEAMKK